VLHALTAIQQEHQALDLSPSQASSSPSPAPMFHYGFNGSNQDSLMESDEQLGVSPPQHNSNSSASSLSVASSRFPDAAVARETTPLLPPLDVP